MKFHMEGDKKDVFNNDFTVPMTSPWTAEIIEKGKEGSDEPVHIINTEAVLNGVTVFHPSSEGPAPQRHPIAIEKKNGLFATTYLLSQIFEGRQVSQKYPLMIKSMQDTGDDSTEKIVETEIIMYCLRMGMDDLKNKLPIEELLKERILNHFRGVFHKAEEEGNLFGIMNDDKKEDKTLFVLPRELIETNFRPFLDALPDNFTKACMEAMSPYIDEANVTLGLNDDTFKFAGILPGMITHSNADSIKNDTLWWKFNYEDFINDDYVMEAASVVYYPKRIQAAIVIGALVILVSLILTSRKRKKS
ncbi:MAG: hypothetical protein QF842_00750 [Candidatus Marinimicrobia bacterium]|nr:hypothetical protein [Candidatus Neomarinimicrobiota bacterium]